MRRCMSIAVPLRLRVIGLLTIGLALTACEDPGENPSGVAYLPESTTRISAPATRDLQLSTGKYQDDIPEYTGAPDPKGRWPAKASTGRTVYRDDADLQVGSEGPYARTDAPDGS